jgi:hypothetical protein
MECELVERHTLRVFRPVERPTVRQMLRIEDVGVKPPNPGVRVGCDEHLSTELSESSLKMCGKRPKCSSGVMWLSMTTKSYVRRSALLTCSYESTICTSARGKFRRSVLSWTGSSSQISRLLTNGA